METLVDEVVREVAGIIMEKKTMTLISWYEKRIQC